MLNGQRSFDQGTAQSRIPGPELLAGLLSLIWLGLVVAYFWLGSSDAGEAPPSSGAVGRVVTVVLPLVLIWVVALSRRTIQQLRQEAEALRATIEELRQSEKPSPKTAEVRVAPPVATPQLPAQAPGRAQVGGHAQAGGQVQASGQAAAQGPSSLPAEATDQPEAEVPAEDTRPPMAIDEFIRAVNFPNSADDHEGIRCLKLALEDREGARLIRAAQDVLSLLAQDGIYVDDLRHDASNPELWRRFAAGERGRAISSLGGVHDRSSLALTSGRMRNDAIFRDVAQHFLRQFDRSLQVFVTSATDRDIAELAETRTARAFMLLGRVAGVFD